MSAYILYLARYTNTLIPRKQIFVLQLKQKYTTLISTLFQLQIIPREFILMENTIEIEEVKPNRNKQIDKKRIIMHVFGVISNADVDVIIKKIMP